jgi:hypothetical protein
MAGTFESRLEILDVAIGERCVVYSTPDRIEAPNWSPDGLWIAVSDKSTPDRKSCIHILPAEGGTPRVVAKLFGGRRPAHEARRSGRLSRRPVEVPVSQRTPLLRDDGAIGERRQISAMKGRDFDDQKREWIRPNPRQPLINPL